LRCKDGDLWITKNTWVVSDSPPRHLDPQDSVTFLGTLSRVDAADIRRLMFSDGMQPSVVPMYLDALRARGGSSALDGLDVTTLRKACKFISADNPAPHPESWADFMKREALQLRTKWTLMRRGLPS
jgi:hypothetical protein